MKFIYSGGGFSREMQRSVLDMFSDEEVKLVDDAPTDNSINYASALKIAEHETCTFSIAFANGALRRKKMQQVVRDGFEIYSIFSKSTIIGENVEIGDGAIFSDYTMVTADAKIGTGFHCNIYSYVAHDCRIGNYVTLAPRVSINGRVIVEDNVYIGTGATVLPGKSGSPIRIGKGAIVGAHALVTCDVPAGATVIGIPAKLIEKR